MRLNNTTATSSNASTTTIQTPAEVQKSAPVSSSVAPRTAGTVGSPPVSDQFAGVSDAKVTVEAPVAREKRFSPTDARFAPIAERAPAKTTQAMFDANPRIVDMLAGALAKLHAFEKGLPPDTTPSPTGLAAFASALADALLPLAPQTSPLAAEQNRFLTLVSRSLGGIDPELTRIDQMWNQRNALGFAGKQLSNLAAGTPPYWAGEQVNAVNTALAALHKVDPAAASLAPLAFDAKTTQGPALAEAARHLVDALPASSEAFAALRLDRARALTTELGQHLAARNATVA